MNSNMRTLTIEIGNQYVHGNVFEMNGAEASLVSHHRMLVSSSPEDMVRSMKRYFEGGFEKCEVVGDRLTAVSQATDFLSSFGTSIGLRFDSSETYVSYSTFGRNRLSKRIEVGCGKGIGDALLSGGVEKITSWFTSTGVANKTALFNTLGRRMLYPNVPIGQDVQASLSALLYLLTSLVGSEVPLTAHNTGLHSTQHAVNSIIVSGEFLTQGLESNKFLLPLIDGLGLDGVWQIVFDPHSILSTLSFVQKEAFFDLSQLGFELSGTVVTLSHNRNWFEELGEVTLDFGLSEPMVLTVFSGEFVVVPVSAEQSGELQFSVDSDVSIKGYSSDLDIRGGKLGVLLDMRGRPIQRYFTHPSYVSQYKKWEALL